MMDKENTSIKYQSFGFLLIPPSRTPPPLMNR